MKRIFAFLVCFVLSVSVCFANQMTEQTGEVAGSTVMYGHDGTNLKKFKTDSDGKAFATLDGEVIDTQYVNSSIAVGEVAGAASATVFPTVTSRLVMFKAVSSNVGKVYIGIAGVTKVDGTTDTTTGWELEAGESTPWIPASNLNLFYRICDNAGDDITYMVIN